jgi:hypothetical protein
MVRRMRSYLLIVAISCGSILAWAQNKNSGCHSFEVTSELAAEKSFERAIGNGLRFQITPDKLDANGKFNGWDILIVHPNAPDQEYIYPVNPPLRFNGLQILGPSYGDDAKVSLGHPHEMWFLLNKADYDQLWPAVEHVLWPYNAPHPDQVADEYSQALSKVATGRLKLSVPSYGLNPGSDSIQRMQFQAEFIVPDGFPVASDLKIKDAACPAAPQ